MVSSEIGRHDFLPLDLSRLVTFLITYEGRVAGIGTPERLRLAPDLEALPQGAPLRVFVWFMWAFYEQVAREALPGPADECHAEFYARSALIDRGDFLLGEAAGLSDAQLTAIFNVPPEQVPKRRKDLAERTERGGAV